MTKPSLKKIFGDFVNIESKAVKSNDESGFGTILAKQLVELMGGELVAESPSGLSGMTGHKSILYNYLPIQMTGQLKIFHLKK